MPPCCGSLAKRVLLSVGAKVPRRWAWAAPLLLWAYLWDPEDSDSPDSPHPHSSDSSSDEPCSSGCDCPGALPPFAALGPPSSRSLESPKLPSRSSWCPRYAEVPGGPVLDTPALLSPFGKTPLSLEAPLSLVPGTLMPGGIGAIGGDGVPLRYAASKGSLHPDPGTLRVYPYPCPYPEPPCCLPTPVSSGALSELERPKAEAEEARGVVACPEERRTSLCWYWGWSCRSWLFMGVPLA